MKLRILLFATVLASLAALSSCKEEKQPSSPGGSDGNSLVIAENGENIEASLRAAEFMVEDLKKEAAQ